MTTISGDAKRNRVNFTKEKMKTAQREIERVALPGLVRHRSVNVSVDDTATQHNYVRHVL